MSQWYQRLFPTRISTMKQCVQEFVTTSHGYRMATSIGGVLTGRGADLIIIDDPLKPEEALSETQRRTTNQWYDHTLYSRLNDKQHGAIVVIMQRLHEDDLVGHLLEQEEGEVVRFPAIAETNEKHAIDTPFGTHRFTRKINDLLHPEREPPETLDRIRKTIGAARVTGREVYVPKT